MAKFQVGSGIDQYVTLLQNLEYSAFDAMGSAIYVGAGIVADEVNKQIRGLPDTACTKKEKAALIDGLGISKMQNDNGYMNVKIGFDGYDSVKTEKYPKGHAVSMIARAIEKGTSFRAATPFVSRAVRATKDKAEKAMAAELDKALGLSVR